MRGIHMMLHNALDRAVKERLILRNPTEDCIIPKIQKQEMKILHPEDMKAYLEAADRRGVLPMFYLELVTGIRKGELTALLWSDLDEERRTISVSKQAVGDRTGMSPSAGPRRRTQYGKFRSLSRRWNCFVRSMKSIRTIPGCSPHPKQERCTIRTPSPNSMRRF